MIKQLKMASIQFFVIDNDNRGMVFVSETVKWHHGSGLSEGLSSCPTRLLAMHFFI